MSKKNQQKPNEKIIEVLNQILVLTDFNQLEIKDKQILISNLILNSIAEFLPDNIKKYADSFLNNGDEIALKAKENPSNYIYQIALKAHLLIALAHKL